MDLLFDNMLVWLVVDGLADCVGGDGKGFVEGFGSIERVFS